MMTLWSHYDHIMITLWSHYDHIMITFIQCDLCLVLKKHKSNISPWSMIYASKQHKECSSFSRVQADSASKGPGGILCLAGSKRLVSSCSVNFGLWVYYTSHKRSTFCALLCTCDVWTDEEFFCVSTWHLPGCTHGQQPHRTSGVH